MSTDATPEAPSLIRLLDPEVLADPYPLHRQLREQAPVHWDPYLHSWVVTRYADVVEVLTRFTAARTPTPERLAELGMGEIAPIASVMVRQMLFLDPPEHTRVRALAHAAFTPRRIEHLREHIRQIADRLVDAAADRGRMDVMADLANPLPAIVTAEMLGVPAEDHQLLKVWSEAFAEMLGNFQHNPGRTANVLAQVAQMTDYFRAAVRAESSRPTSGLINALVTAEIDGDRFSEDDVIANIIVTMVGGQETTTNLIGNGVLTLLRHPDQMRRLLDDPALMPSAVEELLRYESPSQHTARLAPDDVRLGDHDIARGQAVIAVMAAANRDPERFPDPDRLDLARADNRHVAFGWAGHFCFGAPLARMEGAIALDTVLRRLPDLRLDTDEITWRPNLGLRGLTALPVAWGEQAAPAAPKRERATAEGLAALTPERRALLEQRLHGRKLPSRPVDAPLPPVPDEPVPATAEQRQIVFHSLFSPGNPLYNEAATIVHTGVLEVECLRRALQRLVDRHDAWRTTFTRKRREMLQVVHPTVRVELPVHDLRSMPAADRDEAAARLVLDLALAPYDLKQGPLMRPLLVRFTDEEHRLYLAIHHVAFDGVSLQTVVLPELVALYDAEVAGTPAGLGAPVQYTQYALWQEDELPRRLAQELPFWREHLRDAPALRLPLDNPRPNEPRHEGVPSWFELPAELVAALGDLAGTADATLFHALVAGYARLLQKWSGQQDLVLSTVADSRSRRELQSMLGYCLTPVPLRLRFAPELAAPELISLVRGELLDALSHAVPFERLVDDLASTLHDQQPGAAPIFQTQIVLEPQSAVDDPAWSLSQLDPRIGVHFTAAKNEVQIELDHRPDGRVVGRLIADADLFEPTFAERAVAEWITELRSLLKR